MPCCVRGWACVHAEHVQCLRLRADWQQRGYPVYHRFRVLLHTAARALANFASTLRWAAFIADMSPAAYAMRCIACVAKGLLLHAWGWRAGDQRRVARRGIAQHPTVGCAVGDTVPAIRTRSRAALRARAGCHRGACDRMGTAVCRVWRA